MTLTQQTLSGIRFSGGLHRSFRGKIRGSDAENLIPDNV